MHRPILHGTEWVAITGKPLSATAGSAMFHKGGNAVDASCAMLAAGCTLWDAMSWGGETQALIYNPNTKKVIAINSLGVAPTGATPEYFKSLGLTHAPEGADPKSAVTPGTPSGLMTMLAEYGTLSLKDVLEPAMKLAEGYPMEAERIVQIKEKWDEMMQWPYTKELFLMHSEDEYKGPKQGELFVQANLRATLGKLVEAEQAALAEGKSRKEAIYAARKRFYEGDIAEEFARGSQEQGGLITVEDLANYRTKIEEPVMSTYKGIDVYKLDSWVQGPVLLQVLNMLENFDLQALGHNSDEYLHLLYQVMNLAYADRDFYYGDPAFPPEEPMKGLLSKEYAKERIKQINRNQNDPAIGPGDPYPFQQEENPFLHLLKEQKEMTSLFPATAPASNAAFLEDFHAGTTTVQATDKEGWVVSMTPSGGWIPASIAGKTGVGMSQRLQSFVLNEEENPFNVVEPGKRPRATLTPTLTFKDGKPFLSFGVTGGDTQDQKLLQFFLNVVEFDMDVQEAIDAAKIVSFQMHASFGKHEYRPGEMQIHPGISPAIRSSLESKGYELSMSENVSGTINAIFFDWKQQTFWGGASGVSDDYGVAW
ncbi:MAG: gamma-glutamyltransferase [Bacteroidota bacterium]